MAQLELLTMYCERQQDLNGVDEVRIRVNNEQVWFGSIDKGQPRSLGPRSVPFANTAEVEVDEMNGNKAKQIGQPVVIRGAKATQRQATFKTSGAHYELTYRVT